MCLLFALYFTAFFFVSRFLYSFVLPGRAGSGWRRDGNRTHNYMHEQSYFTQFYDMKRGTEERTFDIYSLLFIFIISFAHNSYTRTPSIVFGLLPRKLSDLRCCADPCRLQRSGFTPRRDADWHLASGNGPRTTFFRPFCVEHECNDNKLCCGSHVENCFSTLVRSFRFISPSKPKITAKTIHHFPPQSARRVT